ncbi:MAG: hypothetical protein AAB614_00025 [Patescibacteria group bacterium]
MILMKKKKYYKFRKLEAFFAVLFFVISLSFIFSQWNYNRNSPAQASSHPVKIVGAAWSGSIGWISFVPNCDKDGDGLSDGGVGCPPALDPVITYGILLDTPTDNLSGKAWSDSVGWISFNIADLAGCPDIFPGDVECQPRIVGGNVLGWARALNTSGGGWDGWISLSCLNSGVCGTSYYQVLFSLATGEFSGSAWGDVVIDWVSFKGPTYGVTTAPTTPTVTANSVSILDYCVDNRTPVFVFTYDSSNYYPMTSYEIVVTKVGDVLPFSSISGLLSVSPGESRSITYTGAPLDRSGVVGIDTGYNWSIKVTNTAGVDSSFTDMAGSPDVLIEFNKRPVVDFTWDPLLVFPDIDIDFISGGFAVCYDYDAIAGNDLPRDCTSVDGDTFLWDIVPGATYVGGSSNASADPVVNFPTSGTKIAQLNIWGVGFNTLDVGESCQIIKTLAVRKPAPKFQEQRP